MSEFLTVDVSHSLFSGCSEEEFALLFKYLIIQQYKKNDTILQQGQAGNELYIIEKGQVSVYVTLPGDEKKLTGTLDAGQVFGEVTFLTDTPITATIVAEEDCVCFKCSRSILFMLRISHPELAYKFVVNVCQQIQKKVIYQLQQLQELLIKLTPHLNQEIGVPLKPSPEKEEITMTKSFKANDIFSKLDFFAPLTAEQRAHLLSLMTVHYYARGTPFDITNGRIGLIYSGAVMMFLNQNCFKSIAVFDVEELFLISANQFFPEFADYVTHFPCENSIILELDWEVFSKLHHSHPSIFFHIIYELAHQMASLVYIVNREFVRINCEFKDLLG